MSDISDLVPKNDLLALAARIRELESQIIRMPGVSMPEQPPRTDSCFTCCSKAEIIPMLGVESPAAARTGGCIIGGTGGCFLCGTDACTCCTGDGFVNVLMPGELKRLSGGELVKRLQATRTSE